jgi:DNA-binding LacI/PurR family transcriptional regulator
MAREHPVMADVAKRAGVSMMTVSRVLNGHPRVRPETRERVELAIASLGYRANMAARTLAGGRSRILGVVATETAYFGPSNTLFGIEAAARARAHFVNFATLRRVEEGEMRSTIQHLRNAHVDGAIVIAPSPDAVAALTAEDFGLPLVIMSGDDVPGYVTVSVDQQAGARAATKHLLELGHRRVHHVRGPSRWIDADAREKGWREELRAHSIRPTRPFIGDWSSRSGYEIGRRVAIRDDVTAIFVANDQMAVGLLLALAEAQVVVPAEVSVVGFDDIPESAYLQPPLTTIRQDFAELGRRGVDQLLRIIDGDNSDRHVTLSPDLLVRRSTAPRRGA